MRKFICLISICILIVLSFALVACDNRAKNKEREYTISEKSQAIIEYLSGAKGNYVLSGQQESTWISEDYEFDYIYEKTGKYPAIRGLDYINDDFTGVNERAIKWWNKGGIVTICWHTGKTFS
ncbi:MAG: glycoside hydrolase family 26 protein, partial [Clostridia bacterium]|nr:glycoside hydrolase family 26 protein [Clostridia bacterium]